MEASALTRRRGAVLPHSKRLLAALGDDRLVEQVRRGNAAAFEVVYDRHHRGILAFCRHMLGSRDEAEDAVQQTFASAFSDLESNDRDIRLKAWLYAIARNRCLSMLRARREQPAELDDQPTAGLSDQVQQRADLRELLEDLRELPADQREALVLFELGDLSHADIANVIGVEPVKVKALVFQARSSLIESREARAIPCADIREQLATATGGALRRGPLRRHLRHCDGCRDYRDRVRAQRRSLALVLPVVPSAGLRDSVLAALGLGGGSGGAGAATGAAGAAGGAGASALGGTGAAGGGGLMAALGGAGAAKLAVAATVGAGTLAGGGVAVHQTLGDDEPPAARAAAASPAAAASGSGPAGSAGGPLPAAELAGDAKRDERREQSGRDADRDDADRPGARGRSVAKRARARGRGFGAERARWGRSQRSRGRGRAHGQAGPPSSRGPGRGQGRGASPDAGAPGQRGPRSTGPGTRSGQQGSQGTRPPVGVPPAPPAADDGVESRGDDPVEPPKPPKPDGGDDAERPLGAPLAPLSR